MDAASSAAVRSIVRRRSTTRLGSRTRRDVSVSASRIAQRTWKRANVSKSTPRAGSNASIAPRSPMQPSCTRSSNGTFRPR